MRLFLRRIFLPIISIITFLILGELALRNVPNDYTLKDKYLKGNASKLNTLILGSSHFYRGINPNRLKGHAFNAAMVGQTLDYDLAILKKYESQLKNIQTLIIPISYFSLVASLDTGVEKWRTLNYNIYYEIGNPFVMENLNRKGAHSVSKIFNYYILNESLIRTDSLGWGSRDLNVDLEILKKTGIEAAYRHTKNDFNLFNYQLKNLHEIIEIAARNQWKVIMVTPPAHRYYYMNLDKHQLDLTVNTAKALAKKFDHVSYYNFLTDNNFTDSDFYDADHLNYNGANKLSNILSAKIQFDIPE